MLTEWLLRKAHGIHWHWQVYQVCISSGTRGGMSNDVDVTPRALTPGEVFSGPPAAAVSTQALNPAATSNAESEAPVGANSRVRRVRRVKHELRRGKPPGKDHTVWEYFSVYTEAYKVPHYVWCAIDLEAKSRPRSSSINGSPTNLLHHPNTYEDVKR